MEDTAYSPLPMLSPFPGMDPYLEQSAFWSSFHTRLMVAIADTLATDLRPKYYIEVETRTYMDMPEGELLIGIPDAVVLKDVQLDDSVREEVARQTSPVALKRSPIPVTLPVPIEIKERYLEIRKVSDDTVITVIELLSPANKRPGKGRDTYEAKRLSVLGSQSHLVEIDLLRGNPSMPIKRVHKSADDLSDYYILVSVARQRPQAQLYPFTLKERFPEFLMPLQDADEAIAVDMQAIFEGVCDRASYPSRIDYRQPVPAPKLSPEEQTWIANLLQPYRQAKEL